ncbi:PAS domain-containing sensor histidine kinase, partial [bacterium]|nr:PAS domain-containing sensor histidine kinase [bacterium]
MELKKEIEKGHIQRREYGIHVNLIWVSIGFGAIYWILDSIRDVLAFDRGPFFLRLFSPDIMSLWMRLLIVFIILLFGIYTHALKERTNKSDAGESRTYHTFGIVWVGLAFGGLYWILESMRDVFLTDKGNMIERVLFPDLMSVGTRFLAVLVIILFSAYVQSLMNERYKIEKALRLSEEKFKSYVETSTDLVFQLTKTGQISYVSPKVQDLYGYTPDELIGKYLKVTTPIEEVVRAINALKKVLSGEYVWNLEIKQKAKSGRIVTMEVNAVPVYHANEIIGVQGVMRDITERKQAKEALQSSEKQFRNVIEKNADAIVIVNKDGIVLFANPAAGVLFGREIEELLNKEFGFPITGGETIEIDIFRKDAESLIAEMRVVDIEWEGEKACLASLRDITKRKQAEKAIKEANIKLKKLDQLKSDFLNTVSHELRTPIAVMREGVSLCMDGVGGKVTKVQKGLLDDTLESIDRLDRLVTDLLDISKIEVGRIKLRKSSFDLCKIVQKIQKDYEPQAKNKGIQINVFLPLFPLMIFADEDKITQIFNNLVSNAIRYTKKGSIHIQVDEKKDEIECRVSDTGIGIATENIPKLFSKFEQIGRVEGPGYKGTGLGLAIVKGLVEKHGGRIWVKSELEKGSTFTFTIQKIPFPTI